MEPRHKKPKKRTAFVPSVVFTTAVAGVVPACVIGCGNNGSGGTTTTVANCAYAGNPTDNCPTVAAVGYCAFCDAGHDADATTDAPSDVATDATEAGGDSAGDSVVNVPPDGPLGVADAGFRGD
jgi:hypothetical protein